MAARIAWAERRFCARFRISSSGRPGWNRRASDMKRSSAAARAVAVAALRSRTRAQRSWAARRARVARSAVRNVLLPNSGDLNQGSRFIVFECGPTLATTAAGPDCSAVGDRWRRRRVGTGCLIDRPATTRQTRRGPRRSSTRSSSAIRGAVAPGWIDAAGCCVSASPPRRRAGGRQSRPAASSDRSRTDRR